MYSLRGAVIGSSRNSNTFLRPFPPLDNGSIGYERYYQQYLSERSMNIKTTTKSDTKDFDSITKSQRRFLGMRWLSPFLLQLLFDDGSVVSTYLSGSTGEPVDLLIQYIPITGPIYTAGWNTHCPTILALLRSGTFRILSSPHLSRAPLARARTQPAMSSATRGPNRSTSRSPARRHSPTRRRSPSPSLVRGRAPTGASRLGQIIHVSTDVTGQRALLVSQDGLLTVIDQRKTDGQDLGEGTSFVLASRRLENMIILQAEFSLHNPTHVQVIAMAATSSDGPSMPLVEEHCWVMKLLPGPEEFSPPFELVLTRCLKIPLPGPFQAVAWSPSESSLLILCRTGDLVMVHSQTEAVLVYPQLTQLPAQHVRWHPSEALLLVASKEEVVICDRAMHPLPITYHSTNLIRPSEAAPSEAAHLPLPDLPAPSCADKRPYFLRRPAGNLAGATLGAHLGRSPPTPASPRPEGEDSEAERKDRAEAQVSAASRDHFDDEMLLFRGRSEQMPGIHHGQCVWCIPVEVPAEPEGAAGDTMMPAATTGEPRRAARPGGYTQEMVPHTDHQAESIHFQRELGHHVALVGLEWCPLANDVAVLTRGVDTPPSSLSGPASMGSLQGGATPGTAEGERAPATERAVGCGQSGCSVALYFDRGPLVLLHLETGLLALGEGLTVEGILREYITRGFMYRAVGLLWALPDLSEQVQLLPLVVGALLEDTARLEWRDLLMRILRRLWTRCVASCAEASHPQAAALGAPEDAAPQPAAIPQAARDMVRVVGNQARRCFYAHLQASRFDEAFSIAEMLQSRELFWLGAPDCGPGGASRPGDLTGGAARRESDREQLEAVLGMSAEAAHLQGLLATLQPGPDLAQLAVRDPSRLAQDEALRLGSAASSPPLPLPPLAPAPASSHRPCPCFLSPPLPLPPLTARPSLLLWAGVWLEAQGTLEQLERARSLYTLHHLDDEAGRVGALIGALVRPLEGNVEETLQGLDVAAMLQQAAMATHSRR
ncbi:hypothetical protein PAPYR_6422 [Paratrimastix pyriformis]|uniref:Uncharacterized protein n=1 Tax=Paratrimastix pyriformis TaxID=342808 RepID=A0ABQ8UIZ5_9EUKA|nr:hypothetical protein PAPYR_6422 [Paratrimastix pyriformis]